MTVEEYHFWNYDFLNRHGQNLDTCWKLYGTGYIRGTEFILTVVWGDSTHTFRNCWIMQIYDRGVKKYTLKGLVKYQVMAPAPINPKKHFGIYDPTGTFVLKYSVTIDGVKASNEDEAQYQQREAYRQYYYWDDSFRNKEDKSLMECYEEYGTGEQMIAPDWKMEFIFLSKKQTLKDSWCLRTYEIYYGKNIPASDQEAIAERVLGVFPVHSSKHILVRIDSEDMLEPYHSSEASKKIRELLAAGKTRQVLFPELEYPNLYSFCIPLG